MTNLISVPQNKNTYNNSSKILYDGVSNNSIQKGQNLNTAIDEISRINTYLSTVYKGVIYNDMTANGLILEGATICKYGVNIFTTITDSNNSCRLPEVVEGNSCLIINKGSSPMKVYPYNSVSNINKLSDGEPIIIPDDGLLYEFICIKNPPPNGSWVVIISQIPISSTVTHPYLDITYNMTGITSQYKQLFTNSNDDYTSGDKLYLVKDKLYVFDPITFQWTNLTVSFTQSALFQIKQGMARDNTILCVIEESSNIWKNNIIYSSDSGSTWIFLDAPTTAVYGSVQAISSLDYLVVVGGDVPLSRVYISFNDPYNCQTTIHSSYIYYTDDLGATWVNLNFPITLSGQVTRIIRDIKVYSANKIYVTTTEGIYKFDGSVWTVLTQQFSMKRIVNMSNGYDYFILEINFATQVVLLTKNEFTNLGGPSVIVNGNVVQYSVADSMDSVMKKDGDLYFYNLSDPSISKSTDYGDFISVEKYLPQDLSGISFLDMLYIDNNIYALTSNNKVIRIEI